jgi:flavin reductase (DIM6/NTAB) family NADH-FMN oxidoreductase RutF
MSKPQAPIASAETGATPLDAVLFREGMSRVAGAVHVVTTAGPAGQAGFTATAVTPVTDAPASLLVCMNASGRSATSLIANGVFCVSTLGMHDVAVADAFAGRADLNGADRFTVGDWRPLVTGSPHLATSLVAFDCRLTDARLVATHHVIIGEIVAIHLGASRPALIYRGRAYHALGD